MCARETCRECVYVCVSVLCMRERQFSTTSVNRHFRFTLHSSVYRSSSAKGQAHHSSGLPRERKRKRERDRGREKSRERETGKKMERDGERMRMRERVCERQKESMFSSAATPPPLPTGRANSAHIKRPDHDRGLRLFQYESL